MAVRPFVEGVVLDTKANCVGHVEDLSLSIQIAHYVDSGLALHRGKDEDGGRSTLLLTVKRRTRGSQ